MINTLRYSFALTNAYYANTLIYRAKQLPGVGKFVSTTLYQNDGLKSMANIISLLFTVIRNITNKILYFLLMVIVPILALNLSIANTFGTVLFFLTLVGGIINTELLNPAKNKYYAVVLLRVDSKHYALSSFFAFLTNTMVFMGIILMVLCLHYHLPIWYALMFPLFLASTKIIWVSMMLYYNQNAKKIITENNYKIFIAACLFGLASAYGLPLFLSIVIPNSILFLLMISFLIASIFGLVYLLQYQGYKKLYKKMLTLDTIIFNTADASQKATRQQLNKALTQDLTLDDHIQKKQGYEYFNDIFVARHKKILTHSMKKTALISFTLIIIALIATQVVPDISNQINNILLSSLPYFVFILYMINRGTLVTQAMFFHCDHSMLSYRFYRKPGVILQLFKKRLKTLIKINLVPASIIGAGLSLLLYTTGGTTHPINYFLIFISIVSLSIFFSTHYLILYYLLQPYDINMKEKSWPYTIATIITYLICYYCIGFQAPTIIFASVIVIFTILYDSIALYLIFKHAPTTFKLK